MNEFWDVDSLRLLIADSPLGIMIRSGDKWYYINRTGLRLLGAQSMEEMAGKSVLDFIHKDYYEGTKRKLQELQHGQIVDLLGIKLIRLDKEEIDVEMKAIATMYQGDEAQYIVINDVTELKKSRELLQQSDKLSVIGELAAGIAHEIRNPLTSLMGFIQLLSVNPNVEKAYCEIMLSEIERINMIVNELLLLSKPQKMNLEKVYIIRLLETVVTLLAAQSILHNVQIMTHFKAELNVLVIQGEKNKIKQVFINILKNAIEAMPKGGKVLVLVECKKSHVLVSVIDQGCGIPKDKLSKIGQAFFTTKEKGTGLGLMISYSIIESHRGFMRIKSEEGKGTIVEVQLPLA